MANFLTTLITDRLIPPTVQAQFSAVQKDTSACAVGVLPQPTRSLTETLGQYPDADADPLYAIDQVHADVAACVRWVGGVNGSAGDAVRSRPS